MPEMGLSGLMSGEGKQPAASRSRSSALPRLYGRECVRAEVRAPLRPKTDAPLTRGHCPEHRLGMIWPQRLGRLQLKTVKVLCLLPVRVARFSRSTLSPTTILAGELSRCWDVCNSPPTPKATSI
jgi:hypothetical protein